MIPLATLPPNTRVKVRAVHGGRGLCQRLAAMGFLPGVEVTVIKSDPGGAVIVDLSGGRLMLGRGIAHKIMVEPLP